MTETDCHCSPIGIFAVIPSRLGVGESFAVKIKLLGPLRTLAPQGSWNTRKPRLHGPFNYNVERDIPFLDHCLPAGTYTVRIDGGLALTGPTSIRFDGTRQGVFPGDTRPILVADGFRIMQPGFHFLHLIEEASGIEAWSNPVYVTESPPSTRIYWGDPHWQTYFSDGIRCPEELYAFARDEAFLDFGAITDHMEAITERQWDYFTAVTNDFNNPGQFATLVGQEWTNHEPGHRNIYIRGNAAPLLRSTDPDCDTLPKLWTKLDRLDAIAIPHHPANAIMGVDWSLGWNPRYETAVEMYSVWGSSECTAEAGNPRPIRHCNGEMPGQHVRDALAHGYRLGFVGGGDIHDGRPGDALEYRQPRFAETWPQGFTAALTSTLTRDAIYDAMKHRHTYATTQRRIYLDTYCSGHRMQVRTASDDSIADVALVRDGIVAAQAAPADDNRIVDTTFSIEDLSPNSYCYIRVMTQSGDMAWSSPIWGDDITCRER